MAKKIAYKDLKVIEKTFKEVDTDKSKLALSLIDEAYFLGETLSKLKKKILKDGVVTEMCRGSYSIDRENPALKSYNASLKNYQALLKQITDLLPPEIEIPKDDGFDSFGDDA